MSAVPKLSKKQVFSKQDSSLNNLQGAADV